MLVVKLLLSKLDGWLKFVLTNVSKEKPGLKAGFNSVVFGAHRGEAPIGLEI